MNNLCSKASLLPSLGFGSNTDHVNEVKTIGVDAALYDNYKDVIAEAQKTGQPIIVHAGNISVAQAILMAGMKADLSTAQCSAPPELLKVQCNAPKVKAVALYTDSEFTVEESEKDKATKAQLTAMESLLGISAETKKLIAAEYMRLIRLHPKWKNSKAMRKAGEKYNVKFIIE
jgi:hypothetical protein